MASWTPLFYIWEMTRVCAQVEAGDPSVLDQAKNKLIPMLDAYTNAIDKPGSIRIADIDAAAKLRAVLCEISSYDTGSPPPTGPVSEVWPFAVTATRRGLAARLERAWLTLMAVDSNCLLKRTAPFVAPNPRSSIDGNDLKSTPDTVLSQLAERAQRQFLAKGESKAAWYLLDDWDQWNLIYQELARQLEVLGVDPRTMEADLDTTSPTTVYLVKLWQAVGNAIDHFERGGPELWQSTLVNELQQLREYSAVWEQRRSESKRREDVARKGSKARGKQKKAALKRAIEKFDPGPTSLLNPKIKNSKPYRAKIILRKAKEAHVGGEFPEFDLLPQSAETLRKLI